MLGRLLTISSRSRNTHFFLKNIFLQKNDIIKQKRMFSTSFKDPELARTDKAISLEQNAARLYKNQMFLDADEVCCDELYYIQCYRCSGKQLKSINYRLEMFPFKCNC